MKITKDNFVWKIVSPGEARELFESELFDIYEIFDDDLESKIYTREHLQNAVEINSQLAIEVGQIKLTPCEK